MPEPRIRTKGSPQLRVATHIARVRNSAGVFDYTFDGFMPPERFSFIADEKGRSQSTKECVHFEFTSKDSTGNNLETVAPGTTVENISKCNITCAFPPSGWEGFSGLSFVAPSASDMEAFNKRAYADMYPVIELVMDMPTFITEFTSIPDLFKSSTVKRFIDIAKSSRLKKINGAADDAEKAEKIIARKLKNLKGDKAEVALAGDYLNWQFGWLPTMSDAQALYDTFRNLEKKLDQLIAHANKPQKAYYSERIDVPEKVVDLRESQWNDGLQVKLAKHTVKYTAVMRYSYDLPQLKTLKRDALVKRAYLDALGFNNPLRTIWERVPFSFVLDWLIPVGDFLEQFSNHWVETTAKITDYSLSYKNLSPVNGELIYLRYGTGNYWVACQSQYNFYCRTRALPNDDKFGLRVDNRFGSKQAMLSGALLTTFFGGSKKH